MSYFKRVAQYTPTRFWVNNVTRAQARLAIDAGAYGCTQNPAYLSKVLGSSDDGPYLKEKIQELVSLYKDNDDVVAELQRFAIAGICKYFLPLYEISGGRYGLVSIQANPFKENVQEILDNAEKMGRLVPNAIIKVPATKDGIVAMGVLMREQIAVLATEVMSMDQMLEVCNVYAQTTGSLKSPAPFIFAHINGIFDEHIAASIQRDCISIDPDIARQASLLLGRKMYGYLHDCGWSEVKYLAGGARNLNHFTDWVGVNGGVTINWSNTADILLEKDGPVIDIFNASSSYTVIDTLLAKVPEFYKAYMPGSLQSADYEGFGPVVRFRNQFEMGWTKARDIVASFR